MTYDLEKDGKVYRGNADNHQPHNDPDLRIDEVSGNSDMRVKNPPHYTRGGIETIDYIRAKLRGAGIDPFNAYCLGNVIKYVSRAPFKGKFYEDLEKAKVYIDEMLQSNRS